MNAEKRIQIVEADRDRLQAENKALREALEKASGEFKAIAMLHGIDLSEAISKTNAALSKARP